MKNYFMVYIGKNFELMGQKTITNKEHKEKELLKKKGHNPLIQVDKHSVPVSNFIANFKRQFKEAKALLNWDRLFGCKRTEQKKQTAEPESIIGSTKTVIRSDFKKDEKNQAVKANKKPVLKIGNSIKSKQTHPNSKPKLRL